MVIEDITSLRWRRRQLERSQGALMAEKVHDLEVNREKLHLQFHQDVADVSQAEVLEKGLRNIDDSPAKFEEVLTKLNALIELAKDCDYSCAVPLLTALYGKQASLRAASIFNVFLDLTRRHRERDDALAHRRPWPPPQDDVWKGPDAARVKREPGWDPVLDKPNLSLINDLQKELRDVSEAYQLYIREQVTVTQTKRDAAIAPTQAVSPHLAREIWLVDREIDGKTRLLIYMRKEDRSWRRLKKQDPEEEESPVARQSRNQMERSGEWRVASGEQEESSRAPSGAPPTGPENPTRDVGLGGVRPEPNSEEPPSLGAEGSNDAIFSRNKAEDSLKTKDEALGTNPKQSHGPESECPDRIGPSGAQPAGAESDHQEAASPGAEGSDDGIFRRNKAEDSLKTKDESPGTNPKQSHDPN